MNNIAKELHPKKLRRLFIMAILTACFILGSVIYLIVLRFDQVEFPRDLLMNENKTSIEVEVNNYEFKNNLFSFNLPKPPPPVQVEIQSVNRFVTLKNYKLSGITEIGSSLRALVEDKRGSTHYLAEGRTLNEYKVLQIKRESIVLVEAGFYSTDKESVLSNADVVKYVLYANK